MSMPDRRLQAAALRLIADRVERGERELEALEGLPAWQRSLLDERLAKLDDGLAAQPWREMLAELRADLRRE